MKLKCYQKLNENELRDLYLNKNLSMDELMKYYNLSYSSISRALRYFKINKSRELIALNNKKTCLKKYGVENTSQIAEIKIKKKDTFKMHYGTDYYFQTDTFKQQSKNTREVRYGNKNYNNRKSAEITNLNKYGVKNVLQVKAIKEKAEKTILKKYGVKNASQSKELQYKKYETKKKNKTFYSSNLEEKIYSLLLNKFKNIIRQYTTKKYPFNCDFYIQEKNLYIEIQGNWTHGYMPFEQSEKCLKQLEKWEEKAKTSSFYKTALDVWTRRDVLKRETARKNNLNWIEFFNLDEFMTWYEKQ